MIENLFVTLVVKIWKIHYWTSKSWKPKLCAVWTIYSILLMQFAWKHFFFILFYFVDLCSPLPHFMTTFISQTIISTHLDHALRSLVLDISLSSNSCILSLPIPCRPSIFCSMTTSSRRTAQNLSNSVDFSLRNSVQYGPSFVTCSNPAIKAMQ